MKVKIHESWEIKLKEEFSEPYFEKLIHFVKGAYARHTCYPRGADIFAAFDHCPFEDAKVIIIGQDPYHGPNQANGLCFSVKDGIAHPPSLINIFKEIESDIGVPYPQSGNLERWSKQGVLLLNATLTVQAHSAGSHQNQGWEVFTDAVIKKLSAQREGLIFLLWGGFAKKKIKLIDTKKHHVLSSGHPSPLSANRGYWFGNKHFSKCNDLLRQQNRKVINW
ncbi:uracil-DNA glycosylase [Spongiimicrobium salis]|uniref:uracil-DNA glycosylase n=1 Tax=Spongiimicrobium salis TaxID=1667022 RepID=UPI00374DE8E4